MDTELAKKFEAYQFNVYPGMIRVLSEQLGVSVNAIRKLGVGYDMARGLWVFAERDDKGEIIGLSLRSPDGKKWSEKGSKRGLTYNCVFSGRGATYIPGSHNWQRLSDTRPDVTCPKCGKSDWCLVSADNPKDPRACICQREADGALRQVGKGGYLHVLKFEGDFRVAPILELSELPVLVVEGQTDVIAALDLGFVAVGRPSADGGMDLLRKLLAGRDVCVVGENDEHVDSAGRTIWPGKTGWEITMANLIGHAHSVKGLFPPKGTKDLRKWLQSGLIQDELIEYITKHAEYVACDADIFADDSSPTIAARFLEDNYKVEGVTTLRHYDGMWVLWDDGRYRETSPEKFHGSIYRFLEGKRYKKSTSKGEIQIEPYRPTRGKVLDIIDAMSQWCPIEGHTPQWLNGVNGPDPVNLIIFKNGVLDVSEYAEGKIALHNPNPNLFSLVSLPYAFDENAESKLWQDTSADICSHLQDKQELLAQWIGYNVVPDMSMEALMLFQGRPRSGKGTVLDVMAEILGSEQVCSTSFGSLCSQFGYQPLIGKLAVFLGDAKVPDYGDATVALEKVLQITGGDPVGIDRKFMSAIARTYLTCRFTIAVNNLPALPDQARALETRLQILSFDESYLGREDRTLKTRLRQEAREGKLINYALRGLANLRKAGQFTIPKTSLEVLENFRRLVSPITAFVSECCTKAPLNVFGPAAEKLGYWVSKPEAYDAWVVWCQVNGYKPGCQEQFGQNFSSVCRGVTTGRITQGDQRFRTYQGVKLTSWVYSAYLGKPKGNR